MGSTLSISIFNCSCQLSRRILTRIALIQGGHTDHIATTTCTIITVDFTTHGLAGAQHAQVLDGLAAIGQLHEDSLLSDREEPGSERGTLHLGRRRRKLLRLRPQADPVQVPLESFTTDREARGVHFRSNI